MKPMFRGTALLNNLTQNMGEKEHRRCWVLMVDESMPVCQQWKAKTIIAVQAERIENGKGYDFVRFYISSRALDATSALKAT